MSLISFVIQFTNVLNNIDPGVHDLTFIFCQGLENTCRLHTYDFYFRKPRTYTVKLIKMSTIHI